MNAQNQFVSKFHGFGEGLNNAKVGVNKLNKGSDQLIDGVTQLADASKVTGGLGTLSAGANQMSGGITQLVDGSPSNNWLRYSKWWSKPNVNWLNPANRRCK